MGAPPNKKGFRSNHFARVHHAASRAGVGGWNAFSDVCFSLALFGGGGEGQGDLRAGGGVDDIK